MLRHPMFLPAVRPVTSPTEPIVSVGDSGRSRFILHSSRNNSYFGNGLRKDNAAVTDVLKTGLDSLSSKRIYR